MKYDPHINPFTHADVLKHKVKEVHNVKLEEQTKVVQDVLVTMQKEGMFSRTLDFVLDPELVEYLEAADYNVTVTAERHLDGEQKTLIQVKW